MSRGCGRCAARSMRAEAAANSGRGRGRETERETCRGLRCFFLDFLELIFSKEMIKRLAAVVLVKCHGEHDEVVGIARLCYVLDNACARLRDR